MTTGTLQKLRIGACSWKYPSWQGLVYSRAEGINYLEEYSRRYNTVEIDRWFWSLFPMGKVRMPDPAEAEEYRKAVSDNFRFTVKVPNSITLTHSYSREKTKPGQSNSHFLSASLFSEFLKALRPMHDMLGPLIFQFEYLNRKKMESQDAFERAMETFRRQLPEGFEYAVEIRNPNYINDRFWDFLHRQQWIPVLLQGYWMPSVVKLFEANQERLKAYPTLILRLHGQDREAIEEETGKQWNRIVHARDEELSQIAAMTARFLDLGMTVYVNVNNHYEGSAPLTISRFIEFLQK